MVPADGGVQALVRVSHTEKLIPGFAETFDCLVIADCENATLFLHDVQYLNDAESMQASLLVASELELAFLSPVV